MRQSLIRQSLSLDFGANPFTGATRWLEVTVTCPSGSGTPTTLTPRQEITASPYAIHTRGLFVDDAQNVGIGTNAPAHKLDVSVGANGAYAARIYNAGGDGQGLLVTGGDGSGTNPLLRVETLGQLPRFVVQEGGNIGIGTATPTHKLTVAGPIKSTTGGVVFPDGSVQTTAAADSLWFGPDAQGNISYAEDINVGGGAASWDDSAERVSIRAQSAEWRVGVRNTVSSADASFFIDQPSSPDALTITPQGNVGVGTSSPQAKLDVTGAVAINGVTVINAQGQWVGSTGPGALVFATCTDQAILVCGTSTSGYNGPSYPSQIIINETCANICPLGFASAQASRLDLGCTITISPGIACSASWSVYEPMNECGPPGCSDQYIGECNYGARFGACCACRY